PVATLIPYTTLFRSVRRRSGNWFDPTIDEACRGMEPLLARWSAMSTRALRDEASLGEPGQASLLAGMATLRRIAAVFADIVDAKDRKSTRLNSSHDQ